MLKKILLLFVDLLCSALWTVVPVSSSSHSSPLELWAAEAPYTGHVTTIQCSTKVMWQQYNAAYRSCDNNTVHYTGHMITIKCSTQVMWHQYTVLQVCSSSAACIANRVEWLTLYFHLFPFRWVSPSLQLFSGYRPPPTCVKPGNKNQMLGTHIGFEIIKF